ncbi:putative lipoprotein [Ureaplasma urealyticum serovar 2 str. ATCC 27814]|uniref:membrane protein n=1 Tax=Ureaplasma urealyticum TaxID=2130 RepID=UPI000179413E|nr:membrane protein [Ureaplasma urealyticum]EEH02033.1 putative lipoprotein [Ureaplasma urealyticum serovar 2 str. ATCC 27814]
MKINKKLAKIFAGATSLLVFIPIITACSQKSKLVVGNFDSYMDPDVANEQAKRFRKNNLSYSFYDNNEILGSLIKSKILDVQVASAYEVAKLAKNKLIKKINWSKFDLKDENNQTITSIDGLQKIFTKEVWAISNAYSSYLGDIDNDGKNDQLLEYMIPYFYQDLIFAYRGKKIPSLDDSKKDVYWSDIFKELTRKDGTPNRFLYEQEADLGVGADEKTPISIGKNKTKIVAIDDARTIYDLAKIMELEGDNKNEVIKAINHEIVGINNSINRILKILNDPNIDQEIKEEDAKELKRLQKQLADKQKELKTNVFLPDSSSVRYIENKLNNISNMFKNTHPNSMHLKANSNDVLNDLAMASVVGAIAYSGDIAFAANGGEYTTEADSKYANMKPTSENFHVVRPKNTMSVLDGFTINSTITIENEQAAYEYLHELCFAGLNKKNSDGESKILDYGLNIHRNKTPKAIADYENSTEDQSEVGNVLEDSGYLYTPMRNFDYVQYSPTIKLIANYVLEPNEGLYGKTGFESDLLQEKMIEIFEIDPKYKTKKERQRKHKYIALLNEIINYIYNTYQENNRFVFKDTIINDLYQQKPIKDLIYEYLKNLDLKVDQRNFVHYLLLKFEAIFANINEEVQERAALNQILRKIFDVQLNTDTLEFPTNDLSISNLKLAYLAFREKI